MIALRERVRGCLLAGACGDALGAPVEFMGRGEILDRYGPNGITELENAYGVVGAITDDTQMTLFTVDGLIRAMVRFESKGISNPASTVHHAYLRWYATQTRDYESAMTDETLDGWLIRERRLWARRAPGNTCMSALGAAKGRFGGYRASNDSKGCGTVMRDAAFGFSSSVDQGFGLAMEAAWTTHGHPSARYSSGALAATVGFIVQGRPLQEAVASAIEMLAPLDGANEVVEALRHALALSREPDWRERLPQLGEGWVAEEALAISVLCGLAAPDMREAIVAAVNHSGDSDSTGAITGNLLGAVHGAGAIPFSWLANLELREFIETLAEDFSAAIEGRTSAEALWERYPGW